MRTLLMVWASLVCAVNAQPNFVFLLTDDEDVILHSPNYLPYTQKYFVKGGMELRSMYATTPVCCPSRSSFLTGSHIHNLGVVNNSVSGNCSSKAWQEGPEKQTFVVALEEQGYKTAYFGKYLNNYGQPEVGGTAHVPLGWTEWHGLVGNSKYYNFTLSVNGAAEHHGDDYATDYLTDIVKNRSLAFIRASAERGAPFFAMLAPPAAHDPTEPAPKHGTLLADIKAPRTPNYGCANEDKHWFIRATGGEMPADKMDYADLQYRRRVLTLLSVDELVHDVISELETLGLANNTYIFYTTDNGYHLGQFGIMKDKRLPYETDTHLPGYVRGPTVMGGTKLDTAVLNIDFAPTFLELAGLAGRFRTQISSMDGRSFAGAVLHGPSIQEERSFLVEWNGEGLEENHNGMFGGFVGNEMKTVEPKWNREPVFSYQDAVNNTYRCVRTLGPQVNSLFCTFILEDDFLEYYPDLRTDPWQLKNRVGDLDDTQVQARKAEVCRFATCQGESCRPRSVETFTV